MCRRLNAGISIGSSPPILLLLPLTLLLLLLFLPCAVPPAVQDGDVEKAARWSGRPRRPAGRTRVLVAIRTVAADMTLGFVVTVFLISKRKKKLRIKSCLLLEGYAYMYDGVSDNTNAIFIYRVALEEFIFSVRRYLRPERLPYLRRMRWSHRKTTCLSVKVAHPSRLHPGKVETCPSARRNIVLSYVARTLVYPIVLVLSLSLLPST
ncbi:hypothetical protein CPAR01_12455 [Colletotrichum paranaense]|uniref:Integral membrane protein n=1 Tax=Colletotrichum paranaense TaxID=1914294 RepID=A0ABQ9S6J7_9PEZI|nr:uncharacterized protein CPAR01_12455 [Colletotrichum paranaense]KAK1527897.1 hypothetical protein CPAR01_12455 [Colletotrichum paranaense]